MPYTGHQIYQKMHENAAGTQALEAASESAKALSNGYQSLHDELGKEQKALNEFWVGNGAEAASAGLEPLQRANIEYMGKLENAESTFNGMTLSFNSTRANLRKISANRPQPSITSFSVSGEQDADKWDEDNKHNIQQYNSYHESKNLNLSSFPRHYKPFDATLSGDSVGTTGPASSVGSVGTTAASTGSPAYYGGGGASGSAPQTSGSSYAAGGSYTADPTPAPVASSAASAQSPAVAQPSAANWQPSESGGATSTAAYTPPSPAGSGPGYGPGAGPAPSAGSSGGYGDGYATGRGFGPAGPGGGYSAGRGFGPAGSGGSYGYAGGGSGSYGGGYRGSGSAGGGFGPRGTPDATASGGRSTAASPNSSGSAPARGFSGTSGSTGNGSPYGRAPMMGAGAGRAQGGEDDVHERKYTVTPDDPDSLFGGIPEGTVVAPPVIGE